MLTGEWVAAATALRRGFAANPYIAEILNGSPEPAALAIWHSGDLDGPDAASEYIDLYGSFWRKQPDALAFTRWLFNQPKVMIERAAILEYKEAMLASESAGSSKDIDQKQRLVAAIDDTISRMIVVKRTNAAGRQVWPWMRE
jgi:hypothetical protein